MKIVKFTLAQYDTWIGTGSEWYQKVDFDRDLEEQRKEYEETLKDKDLSKLKGVLGCNCSRLVCGEPRPCVHGHVLGKLLTE